MGFKKKVLHRVYDMARNNPHAVKKLAIVAGAAFLSCIIIAVLLVYLASSGLKGIAASSPDIDLLALQELVANKALVLTETQKTQMLPLAQKISGEQVTPGDRAEIKKQIYGLLEPAQIKQVDERRSVVLKKSGEFTSTPQNIVSVIERYTGISLKPIQNWIDALLSWWKITKPADSARSFGDILNDRM